MAKPENDTGWQLPKIMQDAGEVKGLIQPATGMEEKPCFTCRSWDKDTRKLMQFLNSRGLKADADGNYETPIVNDFKDGRRSIKVNPRDWGYCRNGCMPTHMNATCDVWVPVVSRSELQGKIAP